MSGKDPLKNYYNKRYGSEKITKILSLVDEQLLDGEALKSQAGKYKSTQSQVCRKDLRGSINSGKVYCKVKVTSGW